MAAGRVKGKSPTGVVPGISDLAACHAGQKNLFRGI